MFNPCEKFEPQWHGKHVCFSWIETTRGAHWANTEDWGRGWDKNRLGSMFSLGKENGCISRPFKFNFNHVSFPLPEKKNPEVHIFGIGAQHAKDLQDVRMVGFYLTQLWVFFGGLKHPKNNSGTPQVGLWSTNIPTGFTLNGLVVNQLRNLFWVITASQVKEFHDKAVPRFSYIPGFLRFIMTEVLKNSCRATAEVAKSDREETGSQLDADVFWL